MKLSDQKEAVEKRYIDLEAQFQKLAKERRDEPPVIVDDFALEQVAGPIRLSDCFEGKRDLIVIHNMGIHCNYCTVWADGVNGIQDHLRDRAGLIGPATRYERSFV